ncbi:uncharacterized protein IL334_002070 [Kwoniella shivajii]|uniref:N-acetyltransferase domain-containing protein n=1 Tax=Kwoniella shivajii TaxID=564305 RepID=A0ABZ1CUB7_9TREE|nr:hypothetical protein IL334_002070 [Kwoniella shivajii]
MTILPVEPAHGDIQIQPTPSLTSSPSSAHTKTEKSSVGYSIRQARGTEDAAKISRLLTEVFTITFGHSCTPSELEKYLKDCLSIGPINEEILDPSSTWFLAISNKSKSKSKSKSESESESESDERKNEISKEEEEAEELLGIVQLIKGTRESCVTLPRPIELRRIYLSISAHGSGIASSLFQIAESHSIGLGYQSIWLGCWEDNPRGLRFYQKSGYQICGEHMFDIGGSVQRDVILQKML